MNSISKDILNGRIQNQEFINACDKYREETRKPIREFIDWAIANNIEFYSREGIMRDIYTSTEIEEFLKATIENLNSK